MNRDAKPSQPTSPTSPMSGDPHVDAHARRAAQAGVDRRIEHWLNAAEARHLADLEFREVSRALRALSATYVERRDKIGSGAALAGAGKRAAFALFYAPIHLLLV